MRVGNYNLFPLIKIIERLIFVDLDMKTTASLSMIAIILCSIAGCASKEVSRLQAVNDSLRTQLDTRYSVVETMKEIKLLIDSIDESRNALHANLYEGTSYSEVTSRLTNINHYVKRTEDKLVKIEKDLKSTSGKASAYLMLVDALKDELSIRAGDVEDLEKQINNYKEENKGLVKTVRLQEDEMSKMQSQIIAKQQELMLIEAKVNELVENFKVSEAEAVYARAQAVEEAARRTKLAPAKKKETYKEALELYRKALSLGKQDANAKIAELERKVK
jgi:chromosome segregation ATPase